MGNSKSQSELVAFAKERLLDREDIPTAIRQYLVQEGYREDVANQAVREGYVGLFMLGHFIKENSPKLKVNPFYLDRHHKIEVDRTIKLRRSGGHVGLARLIYTGYNPFSRRKIKGFSLHDNEGEIKRFVYLSYFKEMEKGLLPDKNAPDYHYSYAKAELDEMLEKMKRMYDDPGSNDFEHVIENEMLRPVCFLGDMMKRVLKNYHAPFVIRNSSDEKLTSEYPPAFIER